MSFIIREHGGLGKALGLPFSDQPFMQWPFYKPPAGSSPGDPAHVSACAQHIVCWFFFFRGFYLYASGWSSRAFKRTQFYPALSTPDKNYWNASIASTFHACVVAYYALQRLFFTDGGLSAWTDEKAFWRTDSVVTSLLPFFLGYIVADTTIILQHLSVWKANGPILAHHVMAAIGFGQVLLLGYGQGYAAAGFAMEITTPFVNLRWHLDKAGMSKGSRVYVMNGLVLVALWVLFRILFYTYMLFGGPPVHSRPELALWQKASMLLCFYGGWALQLFWGFKLVRGALKVLGLVGKGAGKKEK
jgi:hypothetical protein